MYNAWVDISNEESYLLAVYADELHSSHGITKAQIKLYFAWILYAILHIAMSSTGF